MRNSASCGTPHHAELHMLFSARDWKPLRKKSPNTPQRCGNPHWISASCGVFKQIFRSMQNSAVGIPQYRNICRIPQDIKKQHRISASNIFHFSNLFHYIFRKVRKCCPNTLQDISASKLAENEGFLRKFEVRVIVGIMWSELYLEHEKSIVFSKTFRETPASPL